MHHKTRNFSAVQQKCVTEVAILDLPEAPNGEFRIFWATLSHPVRTLCGSYNVYPIIYHWKAHTELNQKIQ